MNLLTERYNDRGLSKEKKLIEESTYIKLMEECRGMEDANFPILGKGRIQSDEKIGN